MKTRPTTFELILASALIFTSCAGEEADPSSTSRAPFSTPPVAAEPFDVPALGRTEVGIVANLPLLQADWNHTEFESPPAAHGVWLNHVGVHDSEYVAIAFGWHAPPDNKTV